MKIMKPLESTLLPDFLNFDVFPNLKVNDVVTCIYEKNAKKTLIVVNDKNAEELDFLAKILKAIQYEISEDVILFPLQKDKRINLSAFNKNLTTEIDFILLFGVEASQLDLQFKLPNYYPLKVNNMTFLSADNLASISKNKNLKMKLWQNLQQLFL
jgi:DNA polymerase III psi subunit